MRTPKLTAKRAIGLTVASALAVMGIVTVADMSQAAGSLKLSPSTGKTAGGTIITVTGSGFKDGAGANVAAAVRFISGTTCGVDATAGTAATSFNVVSKTKMSVNSPALAANSYMLCVFDGTTSTETLLGGAKFTTAAAPTATTFAEASSNIATASVMGGTVVTLTGTNFNNKTTATLSSGEKVTVTYVSDTTLSLKLPARSSSSGVTVKVDTGYGTATSSDTITYVSTVSVDPGSGAGAANDVITLTGKGFAAKTFANAPAASSSVVSLSVPGSTTAVAGATIATTGSGTVAPVYCTDVQVLSDSELTCKLPALTSAYGGYIVQVLDTSSGTVATAATAVSASAAYVAAPF